MKIIITEDQLEEVIRRTIQKGNSKKLVGKSKMKTPIGKIGIHIPIMGEDDLEEKWSEKYKKSINCNNPKGFSQKAHCQGRKK